MEATAQYDVDEQFADEREPDPPADEAPYGGLDLGEIPLGLRASDVPIRPWICEGRLLRGAVSILAGYPGAGKTALELATCVSVVSGTSYTGENFVERGRAWLYANEEPTDEMHRRYLAFCKHQGIDPDSTHGRLRLSSGQKHPLVIMRQTPEGIIADPIVDQLLEALKAWKCDFFCVDPQVSTHRVNENSNSDQQEVMSKWCYIAAEADCSIELPSHTPKGQHDDSEAMAGNMGAVRGASSIVGAARNVTTLCKMSEKTAAKYGIGSPAYKSLVRLDPAKNNYSPPAEDALWLRIEGVCLDNHPVRPDWVGVVEPYKEELTEVPRTHGATADKADALESLRVAIMLLDIPQGQSVKVSSVIEELISHTKRGRSWILDSIPLLLDRMDSAAGQRAEYTWHKVTKGKTSPLMLNRGVS